ncbi:uncharacterized protein EURHEDRAFT_542405 [Aspergillus ruber CBS 135680]|uniref:Uncharacterized protein n=1 Tax=Aspergillus ruber (strain CBS 135680) TaxID=1388766 RepID=A0A017S8J7_ASPRC|nr:uncharacterized protein EURHEDRAFT_542405 [Aspergillus ruber CBS 135680]EYE93101.1 hypothetical protein EURHEDRAFT_542405 [Aspergillus ruber CBS 135680]
MVNPVNYLPPTLSNDTIRAFALSQYLANPIAIQALSVTAEYHSIYVLSFNPADADYLVAVMTWLRKNTKVPIPYVVRFDVTSNSVLQHETTLLERVRGKALHEIYNPLSREQLHRRSWNGFSGLAFAAGSRETLVRVYQHEIRFHPFLKSYRDLLPRLDVLVDAFARHSKLNCASYRWDPSRAFLRNGQRNARAVAEQKRIRAIFQQRCRTRGVGQLLFNEPNYTSSLQETMQNGISYLRAIVEVCPRGQR